MLNKQPDDPDVAGIGQLVEENFFNVGIGDHPLQALNALRGRAYWKSAAAYMRAIGPYERRRCLSATAIDGSNASRSDSNAAS